jgi:NitT/TauT family transport system ATP-binding protein
MLDQLESNRLCQPFSALDVLTAENLRSEVLRLWQSGDVPTTCIVIITHSIEEAIQLADRLVILERDPGRVRTTMSVSIPHPRDRKSAEFQDLADTVYRYLTAEDSPVLAGVSSTVKNIVLSPTAFVPEVSALRVPIEQLDLSKPLITTQQQLDCSSGSDLERERYPMLPGVRIGSVAGLLAFILDEPSDLYLLGQRLQLDVDDLYPIIEAGEILGLIDVEDADCAINEQGRRFVTSTIDDRKKIVREAISGPAAVSNGARLVREIYHILRQAGRRARIPQELIFDTILLKNFSPQESRRQLEIAIEWGRFAELYGYESLTGSFFLDVDDEQPHPKSAPDR